MGSTLGGSGSGFPVFLYGIVLIGFFSWAEADVIESLLLGNLIFMTMLAIRKMQKRVPFLPSKYLRRTFSRKNVICIPNFRNRKSRRYIL